MQMHKSAAKPFDSAQIYLSLPHDWAKRLEAGEPETKAIG
jgi:hypothetical protein